MLFLQLSCKKDDDLAPGFDMMYQRQFSIPAGIGIFDVHHFQLKNLPSNWNQYLSDHKVSAEDISAIITAKAALVGVYGDADLSVIEKISVRVYDEASPSDFVEIGYREPAPLNSGNELPVIPSLADTKNFFSQSRFSIDVVLWLRRTTVEQSDVRLDLTMRATF